MSVLVMDEFKTYICTELGLSQQTFSAYSRDATEFIDFIGTQRFTAELIEKFISHLSRKGLRSTTIRRKYMSIRCLCHHLISLGRLDPNILYVVNSVRVERKVYNVLDNENVDALVATVGSRAPTCRATNVLRDVAIILTLHHSGLRASELCSIDLCDVNLIRREIRVAGKGGRDRVVPTTHECIEAIKAYLYSDRESETNAMFVNMDGKRITRRAVSDMLVSLSRRAGVKHTTAHTLRRTCATDLMNKGMELDLVRLLLGHRHLSTTQTYLSISYDRLRKIHKCCHPFGEDNESQKK